MWNPVRIAYFEEDKAELMLGPVRQVVDFLKRQPSVDAVMLSAHWKFGPHVDINVRSERSVFDSLYPVCERMIQAWLAEHPSSVELQPDEYEELSIKLAVSELELPPFVPLLRNNSVTRPEYRRGRAIGLEQLSESKEVFLAQATDLVLSLCATKKDDTETGFITLVLMMASIARRFRPEGVRRGYVSYRSHAEYFFANFDRNGLLRQKMDAIDARYADRIDANLKPVVACDFPALDLAADSVELLRCWERIVEQTYTRNIRVVEQNHGSLVGDGETTAIDSHYVNLANELAGGIPDRYRPSPTGVSAGAVVDAALQHQAGRDLFRSVDFVAYRTTVNFFYMLLPLLDVSPTKKFMLCHLVANAVERVYSVSWRDWIPEAVEKPEPQ